MKTQKVSSLLSLHELELLESLCNRIDEVEAPATNEIQDLISELEDPVRRYFLHELLWHDIERQQIAGQAPSVNDYKYECEEDNTVVRDVFEEVEADRSLREV
jgi:hypothetical protein